MACSLAKPHPCSSKWHQERGRKLNHASACRELWRQHREMSTKRLLAKLKTHVFNLSDYAKPYRSENLRKVDLWYSRMIRTELRRRGVQA